MPGTTMFNRFLALFRSTEPTFIEVNPVNTSTNTYDSKVAAIHMLRVNVKSLAAEAKLIRHEEKRAGIQYQTALQLHRRGRLREEARYAQLALAFLRGRHLRQVELAFSKPVDVKRLGMKLCKFAEFSADDLAKWACQDG